MKSHQELADKAARAITALQEECGPVLERLVDELETPVHYVYVASSLLPSTGLAEQYGEAGAILAAAKRATDQAFSHLLAVSILTGTWERRRELRRSVDEAIRNDFGKGNGDEPEI